MSKRGGVPKGGDEWRKWNSSSHTSFSLPLCSEEDQADGGSCVSGVAARMILTVDLPLSPGDCRIHSSYPLHPRQKSNKLFAAAELPSAIRWLYSYRLECYCEAVLPTRTWISSSFQFSFPPFSFCSHSLSFPPSLLSFIPLCHWNKCWSGMSQCRNVINDVLWRLQGRTLKTARGQRDNAQ